MVVDCARQYFNRPLYMRFFVLMGLLAMAAISSGCQGTTIPERRDIVGSWETKAFTGATIRMTLTETARSVAGAGSWLTVEDDYGFQATGALAIDEVSLYFDFDERPGITFQGYFSEDDVIMGAFTGDGYRRTQVTFERISLSPDE